MAINALNTPLSGMNAAQLRQSVTANNTANVNTPAFQPATARTSDAAYINGVGQGATSTTTTPSAQPGGMPSTYAPPRPGQAATSQVQTSQMAMPPQTPAPVTAPSNVDMITETTNRMSAQNAYSANIPAARAMNEMSQTLMDIQS